MSERIKFTIHGFQQMKLMESGLNNNDALLMAVIKDMYASNSVESIIQDGERYIWISQKYMSDYVPILGSYMTIHRIFTKLKDKGVIDSVVITNKNGVCGKFFYVKPSVLMDELSEYVDVNLANKQNCNSPINKSANRELTKVQDKDTPTINTPTIDSKHSAHSASQSKAPNDTIKEEQLEKITYLWNMIPELPNIRSIRKGTKRYKALNARIKEEGFDTVIEGITKIAKSDFLRGKNNNGWRASFDWFTLPNNFVKVIEGNYDNTKNSSSIDEVGNRLKEMMGSKLNRLE